MRWFDVFVDVLERHGYEVKFEDDDNWDGDEDKITIEGKPLWEFVDSIDKTRSEILQDYIYVVTMHFEERVKSFVNNLLLGKGKDKIPIEYYSYRVEMQARGMPHIHLVAWIEKGFLEEMGIHGEFEDHIKESEALADLLICCKLPSDEKFRKVVSEVQTHDHRESCRKKGTQCRFSYPKLPSKRTIIARPFTKFSQSEKEEILQGETEDQFLERSKKALTKGKEILNSEDISSLT